MQYLETIKKEIEKILIESFGLGEGLRNGKVNFQVGFPEMLEHGDVTTNVCLVASKLVGKNPREVGEVVIAGLQKLDFICEPVEQVGPGFINIWLKQEIVQKNVDTQVGSDGTHFVSKKYDGKRVLVEHTQPNLFKPFTVGHLMNNFTGEYINRSLKFVGANTTPISYPSDISIGIAKAIWSIKNDGGLIQDIFNKTQKEIVKYFGQSYVKGVAEFKRFEEEGVEDKIREIKDIANNLFRENKSEDLEIFEYCKKINLDYIFNFVKDLGSEFDGFIFESESAVRGKEVIMKNVGEEKVFQYSEGAVIYKPGEDRKDINITVFINSEGNPTYAGKDIGLLDIKFKKYNPDFSFYVTDNEQIPHFKVVLDAGGKINKEWEEKSVHVSHGRMTFKGKKMSSRLGGVPSGEEVINAVLEEVKEKAGNEGEGKSRFEGMSAEEIQSLQKEIALSALRVAILRSKPGVNIDFDPERSLSFEGDSGPYLCYTHARCCSLLQKVKSPHPNPPPLGEGSPSSSVFASSKIGGDLIRKLFQFEKIVVDSAEEIAPQKLIKYLFEVAGEFNNFYAHNKIITDNEAETAQKMQLVYFTKKVLEKGLYLIGVKAPEKM